MLLPMATSLLQPHHSVVHDHQAIVAAKAKHRVSTTIGIHIHEQAGVG